jgi:thiol-disulfide isomerase/thioredoxin
MPLHIGGRLRRPFALAAILAASSMALAAAVPSPNHADVPGIDWYPGDVAGAFELAARQDKPVFLYWGAKWCPPCQQLKSSVFARADFIARTRQFVAVYLDGDDPGAQKWGETFHVGGYPTVVILRPDRREVTRLSGGLDLALYADLLDNAQGDIRPIDEVLATLQTAATALTEADCRRLAYYAWELAYIPAEVRKSRAAALAGAAHSCPQLTAVERARLTVTATTLALSPDSVADVASIVADPVRGPAVVDVLEGLDKEFFAAVTATGPAASASFQHDWERTMDQVANNPGRIDADQLYAVGMKLEAARLFAAPAPLPASLAEDARHRVAVALARTTQPYVRAGVVNAVSFIYDQLGDDAAEEALLRGEILTARAPYYYMDDLGELEEQHGHAAAALDWYERAYRESQGDATRFQWGNVYLGALLRLAPDDAQRIRAVAGKVLASLDGPDRISARSRKGLERLDTRVRQWNSSHAHDADVRAIRARMQGICTRLPANDVGLGSCRNFLAGAA